jgi:hypothetical protein
MAKSLSELVRRNIDGWANGLLHDSDLGRLTQEGKFPPQALAVYLESLRYVFVHSHESTVAAAVRARELELRDLSLHLLELAAEQRGREQWAARDLSKLPENAKHGLEPAAASCALVALQRDLSALHPMCFLAYAVWAEYLATLLGSQWLHLLATCGYERSELTAVARHIDASGDNALLGLAALDRCWGGVPSAPAILEGVQRAKRTFEEFCAELCRVAQSANIGADAAR